MPKMTFPRFERSLTLALFLSGLVASTGVLVACGSEPDSDVPEVEDDPSFITDNGSVLPGEYPTWDSGPSFTHDGFPKLTVEIDGAVLDGDDGGGGSCPNSPNCHPGDGGSSDSGGGDDDDGGGAVHDGGGSDASGGLDGSASSDGGGGEPTDGGAGSDAGAEEPDCG